MENLNENSGLDKYTLSRMEKEKKEMEEQIALKIKWRKEIEENKDFQIRLLKYNASSVDGFVNSYINQKYHWHRFGDFYMRKAEEERTKWIDLAHKHLGCILQKQLFDLQCLWRAEEIKLEGIEKCYDFDLWEKDIFNCPILESISQNDIKMYQDFLLKCVLDFTYDNISYIEWQDYHEIKKAYKADDEEFELPEWYEHHYNHTGTTRLLLLPDIRGEKELFYRNIWRKKEHKEYAEKQKDTPKQVMDKRPFISALDNKAMDGFVYNFEDSETQNRYKHYSAAMNNHNDCEKDQQIFVEMLKVNEPIPIEGNYDFKEAIIKAYNSYYARKISEYLPVAFEQYLLNRSMGLLFEKKEHGYDEIAEIYSKSILGGRELNGEPRDFNF